MKETLVVLGILCLLHVSIGQIDYADNSNSKVDIGAWQPKSGENRNGQLVGNIYANFTLDFVRDDPTTGTDYVMEQPIDPTDSDETASSSESSESSLSSESSESSSSSESSESSSSDSEDSPPATGGQRTVSTKKKGSKTRRGSKKKKVSTWTSWKDECLDQLKKGFEEDEKSIKNLKYLCREEKGNAVMECLENEVKYKSKLCTRGFKNSSSSGKCSKRIKKDEPKHWKKYQKDCRDSIKQYGKEYEGVKKFKEKTGKKKYKNKKYKCYCQMIQKGDEIYADISCQALKHRETKSLREKVKEAMYEERTKIYKEKCLNKIKKGERGELGKGDWRCSCRTGPTGKANIDCHVFHNDKRKKTFCILDPREYNFEGEILRFEQKYYAKEDPDGDDLDCRCGFGCEDLNWNRG